MDIPVAIVVGRITMAEGLITFICIYEDPIVMDFEHITG